MWGGVLANGASLSPSLFPPHPGSASAWDPPTITAAHPGTTPQVIIVQYGSVFFQTKALSLDQWLWCVFFGCGTLVWGQLVTTVPTKRIPKTFTWGSGAPDEMMNATGSLVEDGSSGSLSQDVKRTGQILWIRGLTRLQTQVRGVGTRMGSILLFLFRKLSPLGS